MTTDSNGAMTITSPEFSDGGDLPSVLSCNGDGRSPALSWSGVPANAQSLALISDDPDAPDPKAPKLVFVHWVLWDMDPKSGGLPGGVQAGEKPNGGKQGRNDGGKTGWTPPCPPIGRHRYFFKLYALDKQLGPLNGEKTTKADLLAAMKGHVLAEAVVMGTYEQ